MNVSYHPEAMDAESAIADCTFTGWHAELAPEALLPALGELFCGEPSRQGATVALFLAKGRRPGARRVHHPRDCRRRDR